MERLHCSQYTPSIGENIRTSIQQINRRVSVVIVEFNFVKVTTDVIWRSKVKIGLNWDSLLLVMFPCVAKLAGNKQKVLLPQWENEETLYAKQISYACVQ